MSLLDSVKYQDDIQYVCDNQLPWDKLYKKTILISGGTGLLGSFLVDVIMHKNMNHGLNCSVVILGRDEKKAKKRFEHYWEHNLFLFVEHDIASKKQIMIKDKIDYMIHLASNTHPIQYSTDPIGTITTNIIGLQNMLEFAFNQNVIRVAFASSNEIYGENRGDVEFFDEDYCGFINSNTLRAGYPESKRCGEALCQAYIAQKGIDVVIPRFTRSYGPTMLLTDSKAISQFLKNGIRKEDIVLKSAGTQFYSYTYVADAITGLLYVLLLGKTGEAYNISDEASDIMLKDLAVIIAEKSNTKVIYEIPDEIEAAGYSKVTKARLCGNKIKKLGWKAKYDIKTGIERTIDIVQEIYF